MQKGAPKEKLNIGMGLYGRSFALASASNYEIGAPAPKAGQAGQFTREAGYASYYEVSKRRAAVNVLIFPGTISCSFTSCPLFIRVIRTSMSC